MREVVYDYKEFCKKVDIDKPIHHYFLHKSLDQYGCIREIKIVIFGLSKKHGHILKFETVERFDGVCSNKELNERMKAIIMKFVDNFAVPLGSTEGRFEP